MKKYLMGLLLLLSFVLVGCDISERVPIDKSNSGNSNLVDNNNKALEEKKEVNEILIDVFENSFIIKSGYNHLWPEVKVEVIDNYAHLKENYQGLLDFLSRNQVDQRFPIPKGIPELYNEGFFKLNKLALIYLDSSSGSYWHEIDDIIIENNKITIDIYEMIPQGGVTCDMSGSLAFVVMPKDILDIKVNVDKYYLGANNLLIKSRYYKVGYLEKDRITIDNYDDFIDYYDNLVKHIIYLNYDVNLFKQMYSELFFKKYNLTIIRLNSPLNGYYNIDEVYIDGEILMVKLSPTLLGINDDYGMSYGYAYIVTPKNINNVELQFNNIIIINH